MGVTSDGFRVCYGYLTELLLDWHTSMNSDDIISSFPHYYP